MSEILKMINELICDINKSIPINAVYLRGSYLGGNFTNDSDVDIIIVTDHLAKYSQVIRRKILSTCIKKYTKNIDFLCITQNEHKVYSKRPIYLNEKMMLIYSEGEFI